MSEEGKPHCYKNMDNYVTEDCGNCPYYITCYEELMKLAE